MKTIFVVVLCLNLMGCADEDRPLVYTPLPPVALPETPRNVGLGLTPEQQVTDNERWLQEGLQRDQKIEMESEIRQANDNASAARDEANEAMAESMGR